MQRDLAWTIVASGTALAMGFAARQALKGSWRLATGEDPPENPAERDVSWGQALAWAGASAAVVAVSRLLARRGATAGWEHIVGARPPMD